MKTHICGPAPLLRQPLHLYNPWCAEMHTCAGQAYQAAFTSLPSRELYSTLKKLSGADWEHFRPVLMQILQASHHADVLADVFLFEEERDQAIGVADKAGEWNYSLIEKVADVVLPFRPDWVIQAAVNRQKS